MSLDALSPELGSGPLTAEILVVGRDYGAHEAAQGQPFVGAAGDILNGSLKFAGLSRADVRVDNLVPKQPPANDWAAHKPEDIAWGAQRLRALIERQRPKLIVGLGTEVARFLLGEAMPDAGIQELRGYLWDTDFGRVLTTVHPAAVLRDWTPWRALLNLDMRRAAAEVRAGCPPLDQREVTIVTDPVQVDELRSAIRGVGRGMAVPFLATDIENTSDLQLACVGFAPSIKHAWVIPTAQPWQLAVIQELCESSVPKVLQNGQYDRFFLRRFAGVELRSHAFDTQLAWHAINPELAGKKMQIGVRRKTHSRHTVKNLAFFGSIYTRDSWWKVYSYKDESERYTLCGKDCCVTLDVALKMAAQLESA